MTSSKIWLCGATWGAEDLYDQFIAEDQWILGWTNDPPPDGRPGQFEKALQIQPGDTIVIKKWCGRAAAGLMRIRARGVVLDTPTIKDGLVCCPVIWQSKDLDKVVDLHGCVKAIRGPYVYGVKASDDTWLNTVLS